MKSLKSFADSKRVKYGTLNIIFIAIVIAIVIMVNSIFTVLSSAKNWYIDMTKEQLYTISDPLVELLTEVSQDVEIDIIFCQDKDRVQEHYSDINSGNVLAYVFATANQIAERLDNVSIVYKDPVKDYEFMKTFTTLSSELRPSESTVIIARKDEKGNYTKMYRTLHAASFYTFEELVDGSRGIYGYNGERTFATAILSLTMDKVPTVYFVTGHGEELAKVTSNGKYAKHESIVTFEDCGYKIRYIDLMDKQYTCPTGGCGQSWGMMEFDFGEEGDKSVTFTCDRCEKEYTVKATDFTEARAIPQDARAIVICNPETDYNAEIELTQLGTYLTTYKGTIFCFVDPEGKEDVGGKRLKNLRDFIKNQTGVTILDDDIVTDTSSSSGFGTNDFRGEIANNNAAKTYLSVLQGFGASSPAFKESGILEIDDRYSNADTQGYNDNLALRYTLPIIQTSPSAVYAGKAGKHNLMTVTSLTSTVSNEAAYSYFVVCPSASFIDDSFLVETKYPNEEIMYSLIHSTTAVNVPVNLDFKTFQNYDLDISAAQQRTLFICLLTILPAITIGVGMVILVRRKNK